MAGSPEPELREHPDEDVISAFVEARLDTAESLPIVSHLVACGICRRTTAQLVRLETELSESANSGSLEEPPSRLGSFVDRLAARLIPHSEEDVVFAYQSPETEQDQSPSLATDNETESPDKDSRET
jgi:hypothetical protein